MDIESSFIKYFTTLFQSSKPSEQTLQQVMRVIPSRVTPYMNRILMALFSEGVITQAIKEVFPTKAPGPDGFPTLFYQKYWQVVGPKTVANFLAILNGGGNINELNETNIALIPKSTNPRLISFYEV